MSQALDSGENATRRTKKGLSALPPDLRKVIKQLIAALLKQPRQCQDLYAEILQCIVDDMRTHITYVTEDLSQVFAQKKPMDTFLVGQVAISPQTNSKVCEQVLEALERVYPDIKTRWALSVCMPLGPESDSAYFCLIRDDDRDLVAATSRSSLQVA